MVGFDLLGGADDADNGVVLRTERDVEEEVLGIGGRGDR